MEEVSKEEDPFGLSCALDHFNEHEEVFQMIDNLPNLLEAETSAQERAYERFSLVLGQYIEQPHLIDSHIAQLLEKLVAIIRNNSSSLQLKHITFKYMFVVVNVRGYKVIVRHLPHEVADFEPVLQLLEAQDPNDSDTWTTRYILLLWLSIIVMIPFHMSRFDGFDEEHKSDKTVMSRVLDMIKTYAVVADKCRDASACLCYKFITRSDVKEMHLSSFLDWTFELSLAEDSSVFVKYGTLACVAMILKHGKRADLLPHARRLLDWIINTEFKNNSGSNVQKLVYKIIQRIGLTYLPPRVATWRYKRGNRSLTANLSAGDGTTPSLHPVTATLEPPAEVDVAEDIEVPDEIEEVVDQLIQGLRSADGVVRWSAAKGIGRVTGRLPKDLADEVVGSVLELFSPREGDGAWHGGCLALAELGRRGLLLPTRLPQVVPVILQALVYDEPRGYASVGSHIRDAACYVCWSFARAYETQDLAPFVNNIASTLLVVTCFDKEINCRRAASAAFQENVGRQGTFPHGIDILTEADFFSVSVRGNAYLDISVFIAQWEEYTIPLINHLVEVKVHHWDNAIRELTARALHNLTPRNLDYMSQKVLPLLFQKVITIDLHTRHGTVLAIGEIIHSVAEHTEPNETLKDVFDPFLTENIRKLILYFKEHLYFRGLGGELMKQACSVYIEKCSLAKMPFHNDEIIDDWLNLLNECIAYKTSNIRSSAISALPKLLKEYYSSPEQLPKVNGLVKHYVSELLSTSMEVTRMGHALALGALPKFVLLPHLDFIVTSLIQSVVSDHITSKWAESRRDAVKALTRIATETANEIGNEFSDDLVLKVIHTFLEGLRDYTQDKRGDIGAWMREASMTGLQTMILLLATHRRELLNEHLMTRILSQIAQQAVEKIDRTRALGGRVFYSFLYHEPTIPNIVHFEKICAIFPKDECDILNWNSAASTFQKFVQLLQFSEYTYNVMLGLICSIGGLTETLVRNSSHALYDFLHSEIKIKGTEEISRICEVIYGIFNDYQKIDRITVPMFRFIDKLFDSGCINLIIQDTNSDFAKRILKLVQLEIAGCKDIYKLIDGINLLCQFIQIKGDVGETALIQLSILLCHRQPYVRRSTSTKLYESMLCYGDNSNVNADNLDEIMEMLSGTNWEDGVEDIKPVRNKLCCLMGIRVPVARRKT